MKFKAIMLLGIAMLVFMGCRDKKKEEAEAAAVVEEVEAIEAEIENNSKNLESDTRELEDALKELDSI